MYTTYAIVNCYFNNVFYAFRCFCVTTNILRLLRKGILVYTVHELFVEGLTLNLTIVNTHTE